MKHTPTIYLLFAKVAQDLYTEGFLTAVLCLSSLSFFLLFQTFVVFCVCVSCEILLCFLSIFYIIMLPFLQVVMMVRFFHGSVQLTNHIQNDQMPYPMQLELYPIQYEVDESQT